MVLHSLVVVMNFAMVTRLMALSLSASPHKYEVCDCLNWKTMYINGAIKCGYGKEIRNEANSSIQAMYEANNKFAREVTCGRFWFRLDSNRCANLNVGKDEGTWCYVDPACKSLNGGGKSQGHLLWKKCSHNEPKLRDYAPEELHKISKQTDVWFGGLHKMSYPGSKAGESQLANISDFKKEIPHWVTLKIKESGNSGKPYWFDTNANGNLPTVIVYGKKAYKVEDGTDQDVQHPGTWSILKCIVGC